MGLFGNLKTDGLAESEDRLGGYSPLKSDIYTGKVKMAYAGKAQSGAMSITMELEFPGGKTHRETLYVTNRNGENFFIHKDDKKTKVPLPGFTIVDDICLATLSKPLAEMDSEEKTVKIYDPEQKKEVPQSAQVLTELLGQEVSVAILQTLENKSEKRGNEYVPIAAERTVSSIEKVFNTESRMTVAEARQGLDAPAFWDLWLERNKDAVRDRRTIKDGAGGQNGQSGRPMARPVAGASAGAPAGGAPRTSLFGKGKAT